MFENLVLALWREACQQRNLEELAPRMLRVLQAELPVGQISIRQLESNPTSLVTVAHTDHQQVNEIGKRQVLTDAEFRKLNNWAKQALPLQQERKSVSLIRLLDSTPTDKDLVAIPLTKDRQTLGCLLLYGETARSFQSRHLKMIGQLHEPVAAALANAELRHEMNRLQQAAEADKGALLRRLGRTDLGDTIIGEQTGLRPVMERVKLVVDSEVPVLILGETGTGKELVARALHVRGKRQRGPFIRVNCGAIPAELIDSQLFGHEKGSFTGAEQARQGWFERADGGTLFLDEIGELPLEAQVRFLRVLQDGFVERVGGQHPIHVDVRIIAATHRDLPAMIREARFREDLWYRLAVFPVLLPPLRERLADIPELASFFAERAAARFGLPCVYPDQDNVRLLQSYDWPGNIRELGAVIDRAAILGNGEQLEIAKSLGKGESVSVRSSTKGDRQPDRLPSNPESMSLDAVIREHIQRVLVATEGQVEGRHGAAQLLQINPHTLRARMRKLKIDWTKFRKE